MILFLFNFNVKVLICQGLLCREVILNKIKDRVREIIVGWLWKLLERFVLFSQGECGKIWKKFENWFWDFLKFVYVYLISILYKVLELFQLKLDVIL